MVTKVIDSIQGSFRLKPIQISILLTMSVLVLWSVSLIQAKITIDDLGIAKSLPISYFAAMALLTITSGILWRSCENHNFLLCFQLCLLIAILWLTPLLLGTTLLSTRYAFSYYSNTEYVIRFGHLNSLSEWTHNWPSLPLFQTALMEIIGTRNDDITLIISPFILRIVMILPLSLLLRNITKNNKYHWAAIWIFFLFDFTGQFFLSHQILALLLMWTILALVVKSPSWAEFKNPILSFVIILLTTSLVITHLLTSIICLAIIVIFWIKQRQNLSVFTVFFIVLVAAWTMYVAKGFFQGYTPKIIVNLFRLDLLWQANISDRMTVANEGHLLVAYSRILLSALIIIVGFIGLIISIRSRDEADRNATKIAEGILITLPFGLYATEMIFRVYLFLLPVLAYFGTKFLKTKIFTTVLIVLLIATIPLSLISIHGNQAQDYISPSQREYWRFVEEKGSVGRYTGGGMVWTWSLGYIGTIFDPSLHALSLKEAYLWREKLLKSDWPPDEDTAYIGLSSFENALYTIWYSDKQFIPELRSWLNYSHKYNLVFSSDDVTSYINE